MLRPVIAIAATAIVALAGLPAIAQAAPFNAAGLKTAADGSDLVQVRGGRGGGGFRGGGFGGGHRVGGGSFGGKHHFGGNRHAGHRPPIGCKAIWCRPSHGHGHRHKGIRIVIGGGYDNGPGCGEFYRRWQATGSRFWRSEYYACIGE